MIHDIYRLAACIIQIMSNFWIETADNVIYKCVWMLHESVVPIKPLHLFDLPKIRQCLDKCSKNESTYSYWGAGTISDMSNQRI